MSIFPPMRVEGDVLQPFGQVSMLGKRHGAEQRARAAKPFRLAEPITVRCCARGQQIACVALGASATVGELRGLAAAAHNVPVHGVRLFAEPTSFPVRALRLLDDDTQAVVSAGLADGSAVHIMPRADD